MGEALPGFQSVIEGFGDPRGTLLVGFSQGAIMSLHAVATGLSVAGVIALSGRLAGPVAARTEWPPVTLLHGTADTVMPPEFAMSTHGWLREAGAEPELQLFDGLEHGIDERVIAAIRMTVRGERT